MHAANNLIRQLPEEEADTGERLWGMLMRLEHVQRDVLLRTIVQLRDDLGYRV